MHTDVSLEQLEQAIRALPPARRSEVLQFIEFLEYRDHREEPHLWRAVQAHQSYRAAHPDEPADVYESGEAFLRATDDL